MYIPLIAKQMEPFNPKSEESWKLEWDKKIFIFRGSENFHFQDGCPIRGDNILGGWCPSWYFITGWGNPVMGASLWWSGEHTLIYREAAAQLYGGINNIGLHRGKKCSPHSPLTIIVCIVVSTPDHPPFLPSTPIKSANCQSLPF